MLKCGDSSLAPSGDAAAVAVCGRYIVDHAEHCSCLDRGPRCLHRFVYKFVGQCVERRRVVYERKGDGATELQSLLT